MRETGRILIAGAGPVGCVAALSLARRGIPVTLFEAESQLPALSRASTFHPPTLDMLDELGVAAGVIAHGLVCPVWQYRDRARGIVAEWNLGFLADHTRHPYRVQCEQHRLTALIAGLLEELPEAELRFNARVAGVSQNAGSVTVQLETPDGTEQVTGAYLIGADGASSLVRKAVGIAFDGLTFPELWLVASTPFDFSQRFDSLAPISYVADPEEWFVFVRVPGLWRVLVPARAGETADDIVAEDNLQARMQRVCATGEPYEIAHRTAYPVHQRVAARYRAGRVLLAGDAAHINNPLGGMGMNGGIHDAVNLADKLALVWRGEAEPATLDRYDRQRRSIALEYVQSATLRNKELLEEQDATVRHARQDALRETAADPAKAKEFLLRSSMISALRRAEALS
jgi:3-(3-hydroxy-phenyl)propionate hydroxylase